MFLFISLIKQIEHKLKRLLISHRILNRIKFHNFQTNVFSLFLEPDLESNRTVEIGLVNLVQGGVYTVSIIGNESSESSSTKVGTFQLTSENSISMLWLIPQYFVMVIAEVFFSVTGLEFSYSQVFYVNVKIM